MTRPASSAAFAFGSGTQRPTHRMTNSLMASALEGRHETTQIDGQWTEGAHRHPLGGSALTRAVLGERSRCHAVVGDFSSGDSRSFLPVGSRAMERPATGETWLRRVQVVPRE